VLAVDIEGFHAHEIWADPGTSILLLSDVPHDSEAFFVLEGGLTLRLQGSDRPLDQGTWVFVPSRLEHSLAVTDGSPARLLHISATGGDSNEVVIRRAGGAEGERITDRPERRATVLVETDALTISEFHYGPGERGAKPHVHHLHADAFLVVEGEFTFHLRDGSRSLPAGTLIVLPPGVVHGFDNDSSTHARCFNFHMPSLGFADYLRGRNPGFDQHDPPADGGIDPAAVVVSRLSD
jgi:quercetin dioxygenase-like cupin family protein